MYVFQIGNFVESAIVEGNSADLADFAESAISELALSAVNLVFYNPDHYFYIKPII